MQSYLVTDYGHHGTLLNMINMFRAKSQPIPEVCLTRRAPPHPPLRPDWPNPLRFCRLVL